MLLLDEPMVFDQKQKKRINTFIAHKKAEKYQNSGFNNTYYLGYRDIPNLINKYVIGNKAIDYGCGTGRSTRFLASLGFETIGVDINKKMLLQAISINDSSHYLHIRNARIPVMDASYDLAFSCFVFFTLSTKDKILGILKEIHRSLKDDGFFIIVTGSDELYSHDWVSYDMNFLENRNLLSGSKVKVKLKDIGVEFTNYFWQQEDYKELFALSNFRLVEKHFPLGTSADNKPWLSESKFPPYVVYVLQKKCEAKR